ncbi:unnamed protein product [Urochloa decumbens]|uniref:DUF4283 domain-containing protein n=1 Tax=Urochloa decumbens TaxID=240449 RepID=A0ABC9AQH8_9POAL
MCGHGLLGQGFYSIHIPANKEEKKKKVLGIMTIEYGFANIEVIEKELRHLFREVPRWPIRKLNEDNEYLITFPDEETRFQCSKFRGFDFETAIVKAKVKNTAVSPDVDSNLEVVWVKAFNFPPQAKKVEVVMEVAYIVGDPEEVDLNSLNRPGPVRIKLACRNAKQVRGETQVFFNGESCQIRWEVESTKSQDTPSDSAPSKFDRRRSGEEDEEEEESNDMHNNQGAKTSKQGEKRATQLEGSGQQRKGYTGKQHAQTYEGDKTKDNPKAVDTQMDTQVGGDNSNTDNMDLETGTTNLNVGDEKAIEESLTDAEEDIVGTQLSTCGDTIITEEETMEEELIDYEEDPLYTEKMEMQQLEAKIEVRASKLAAVMNLDSPFKKTVTVKCGKNVTTQVNIEGETDSKKTENKLITDDYGSNVQEGFIPVKTKTAPNRVQRRSTRNQNTAAMKVQDKAEANKKKNNEISKMEAVTQGRRGSSCGQGDPKDKAVPIILAS